VNEELKEVAYLVCIWLLQDPIPEEYATMQEIATTTVTFPSASRDALAEILRQGAQAMLTTEIETKVDGAIALYTPPTTGQIASVGKQPSWPDSQPRIPHHQPPGATPRFDSYSLTLRERAGVREQLNSSKLPL
jgi:hypothetical protein